VVSREVKKKIKEVIKESNIKLDESSSDESEKKEVKEKKKDFILKEEKVIDYSYLRLPENKVVFELKNTDNEIKTKSKNNILSMIDKAHNILYTAENIEGEDALNDIMNWIFIKCIQPIITDKPEEGKIDLLNKKYYNKIYDDETLNEIFSYFKDLKLLAKQEMKNIRCVDEQHEDIITQMSIILKTHHTTKMIFSDNNFKTKKATTIQLLLNEVINKLDMSEIEKNEDVIGEIYEHIINGYTMKKGSKLGQFFTPRNLMQLIVQYKLQRILKLIKDSKDDKITIGDTCMGTGGWLVTVYNILKHNKCNNKLLLTGGEVKPSTFQYGLMNLIMTLKEFPHDAQCESSLTHINNIKNNFIFTNPPFQTTKKFDQIEQNYKLDKYNETNKIKLDEVYKLKDNSPPIQFLELDYYKLEDNGMCVIILPYGELFFGSSYKGAREHFMKNCNVTDIILFQGGLFTHTDIKTCALIFEKDKNGTKQINFIRANKDCTNLTNITTVKIEDINKEPLKSWYVCDYLTDVYIESLSSKITNFEWVEFNNIFTLEKGKIQSSKVEEDENGIGVMVTQSKDISDYKKISNWKVKGENLFISNIDSGKKFCLIFYDGKCDYTNLLELCKVNDKYKDKIYIKFTYYFLKSLIEHLTTNYLKGSCNLSLDRKNLDRIKIPIPPIDIQNKIINKLDSSNDKVKYMKLIVESFKEDIKNFFETTIQIENNKPETEWIEFNKVFSLEKGKIQSSKVEEDEDGIVFVTGAKDENFKTIVKQNISYLNGENIFISPNGNGNKRPVKYFNGECNYSDLLAVINVNKKYESRINKKYIFYFLKYIQEHIEDTYQKGSCNQSLDQKNFDRMKIQIPSIIQQNKCIDKINEMENIIKRWEKDIDDMINNNCNKFMEIFENESIKYNSNKYNSNKYNSNKYNSNKYNSNNNNKLQTDNDDVDVLDEELTELNTNIPKGKKKTQSKVNYLINS